ncbi:hypothetical protein ACHAXT_007927 [Thalassiosira profunda]
MASPPKTILITGASGYVGQHLIANLAKHGLHADDESSDDAFTDSVHIQRYELFVAYNSLVTFEDDLKELLEWQPLHPSISGVTPIPRVDFAKPYIIDTLQSVCGEIDAIVHLAALSSPGYCEKNAETAWKVNVPVGLLGLGAPIIYMSTDQVYEGTKQLYREDEDETVPVNVYGRTKLAFERVLSRDEESKGPLLSDKELGGASLPEIPFVPSPFSVILRSSLILGPPTPLKNGCGKGDCPSFLQFIEGRLKSATPTDYFTNEYRSVVYIDDVVAAIRYFLQQLTTDVSVATHDKCRVFNLGGTTRASRYDIAKEAAEYLQLDASSAKGVERPAGGGGLRSPPDISMNVDKIQTEMECNMKGLAETVELTFDSD